MNRLWLRLNGILFVLLLALVLGLLGWLSQRHGTAWHWGGSLRTELSEPSQRLLAQAQGEITVVAFAPPGHLLRRHLRDLLTQYQAAKPDFRVELIDPEARPDLVRKLGIQRVGTVVLNYQGRSEQVTVPTEAHLSAALERLLRQGGQYIVFPQGHGERDLLGARNFDLGTFGQNLERKGYRLMALNLGREPIPDNTALLVLTPPQSELLPSALAALEQYLARGGNLLWLGDPGEGEQLAGLAAQLGLEWLPGPVLDPAAAQALAVDDPRLVLLDKPAPHPTTARLSAPVLLFQAQALAGEGWQPLLVARGGQFRLPEYQPGQALPTPVNPPPLLLGAALTRSVEGKRQRVVAIGDGDFLSNTYLGNGANLPLGLNLVDWLTESELFLDSYTRPVPDQVVDLSQTQQVLVVVGLMLALPLLCLIGAGWAYWRRRRG